MRIKASFILLTCIAAATHAKVPDRCRVVYRDAGAVPFDDQCFIYAASAAVDLGTYQCTARPEYVTEYCNTLPPYDEGIEDNGDDDGESDTGGSTDGGDSAGVDGGGGTDTSGDGGTGGDGVGTSGSGDDGQSDEQQTDGSGTSGGQSGTEGPEVIIGGTSTAGDSGLPTFEEYPTDDDSNGTGGSSDCFTPDNPLPTTNGAFDFTFTQGWQFLDGPLGHYSNVATLLSVANLSSGVTHAQETGDTSRMFQSIYGIVLPLFPSDSPVSVAFQDFSNLTDTLSGSECK